VACSSASCWRDPRADRLAPDLPDLRPDRALRHGVGLPEAGGARPAPPRPHRLGGQRHLRSRSRGHHGRHHLRDRAIRGAPHGLDKPGGARRARCRDCPARRLRAHRDQGGGAHVPPAAVPHPCLHRGSTVQLPRRPGAWRPHVHAHHLAAGHLAAAARLQLRAHAAVGRHLHVAVDGRLPHRRTALGNPLRPVGCKYSIMPRIRTRE